MPETPVLTTFRDPALSLWQSAIQSVLSKNAMFSLESAADPVLDAVAHPMMLATVAAANQFVAPHAETPLGLEAADCASLYLNLAVAKFRRQADRVAELENEVRFSSCDPLWTACLAEYAGFLAQFDKQPYTPWTKLDDFVLETLPEHAAIAIVGDWGTGMSDATGLLQQIKDNFHPEILVHLGDIYYSGTESETQSNFLNPIQQVFGQQLPMIFTLDGNHDRYSGAKGYYKLLNTLKQPNSYFCLRNQDWQLLALDTGYHDADPLTVTTNVTHLEPSEVAWHLDKLTPAQGGGQTRGTILLSHHQFCSFQGVGKVDGAQQAVNPNLYEAFQSVLGSIDLWLWGHEHNLLIFEPYSGLQRGRCVGASAVPILTNQAVNDLVKDLKAGPGEAGPPTVKAQTGLSHNDRIFHHAYAIVKLAGAEAEVSYYEVDSSGWRPGDAAPALLPALFVERLAAPAIRKVTATG